MNSPKNLEIKGNLRVNPLAELLSEIAENKFNGSLRLACDEQKAVVYFDAGDMVFAVSNARCHRLFEMLLQAGNITKEQLLNIENFTSDLALKENLLKNNLMDAAEIERLFPRQISEIIKTALIWKAGEWTFSPLVRVKGDIRFSVDLLDLLIEYARNLPADAAARRFKNIDESFKAKPSMPAGVNLSPSESFVFSRFENAALTIGEIQNLSGLPEAQTFQILYALWLGGFLDRLNWNAAFSEKTIAAISSAKLTAKKELAEKETVKSGVQSLSSEVSPAEVETPETTEEAAPKEKGISLEKYLDRTEKAKNLYEVFALAPEAAVAEIKQTYFGLAKRFHPDLFHKEADAALLQRIQNAFGIIARGYETLKNEVSRDVYNFKMRKELEELREQSNAGVEPEEIDMQKQNNQAQENFEQGFDLVMKENYEAAVPFLARAAHFVPNNARYRAYYGKALSADNKQRHKAEAELQKAVKLDSKNTDYRIMLARFFLQVGLLKRAEGELNRLLTVSPNHREAKTLLDSLVKNS